MDLFSHTRSFQFTGKSLRLGVYPYDLEAANVKTNSMCSHTLLMTSGGLRNVTLHERETPNSVMLNFREYWKCKSLFNEAVISWLFALKACRVSNFFISMVWHRWRTNDDGFSTQVTTTTEDKQYLFNYRDKSWDGAFRRVEMEIAYSYANSCDAREISIEFAESCASRLLGRDAKNCRLVWSDEIVGIKSWERHISLCAERSD